MTTLSPSSMKDATMRRPDAFLTGVGDTDDLDFVPLDDAEEQVDRDERVCDDADFVEQFNDEEDRVSSNDRACRATREQTKQVVLFCWLASRREGCCPACRALDFRHRR
mmetsp:Transcript_22354/g.48630  ORF Transcript_22354/g.48630 Transcript_22354/m.48630 type:complete len:109 (+) Transcript_22354:1793-2119(+)